MADDGNDDPVELPSDATRKAMFMLRLEMEAINRLAFSDTISKVLPQLNLGSIGAKIMLPNIQGPVSSQSSALLKSLAVDPLRQQSLEAKWRREFQERSSRVLPATSRPPFSGPETAKCDTAEVAAPSPSVSFADARELKPGVASEPTRLVGTFRRTGKVWTISFQGLTIHLTDLKGLSYLAELLRSAHKDVSAARLSGKTGAELVEAGLPASDDMAVRKVRAQLADLEKHLGEIPPAECDKRAKLERECAQCRLYLRNVQGKRGRLRKDKDVGERSRTAVTNALNRVFVRLDEQHPALSLHLKSAIATGTTLSYRPSDAVDWQF